MMPSDTTPGAGFVTASAALLDGAGRAFHPVLMAHIPLLQVMKELLQQMFVTPKGHPKSKPFFDHVISFSWCDNRIWLRNYQLIVALDKKQVKQEGVTLVEVGPRLTLQPIKVRSLRT